MTSKMQLSDGRTLCYEEYGAKEGAPVIYFHGLAGSRLEVKRFDEIASKNNYRLISVDRPGVGHSTMDRKRSILSFSKDIVELADHLKLDKFSIFGHSGGGPYVAACAYKIPERLRKAAIVSGPAPFDNPESSKGMGKEQLMPVKLVNLFPFLSTPMMFMTRMMLNNSEKMLNKMIQPLCEADKRVFLDEKSRKELISSSLEGFAEGLSGPALDMQLLFKPWGFNLSEVTFPITLWYGLDDTQAPISLGRLNQKLLKNASLNEIKGEGHHSLIKNHFEEILYQL